MNNIELLYLFISQFVAVRLYTKNQGENILSGKENEEIAYTRIL